MPTIKFWNWFGRFELLETFYETFNEANCYMFTMGLFKVVIKSTVPMEAGIWLMLSFAYSDQI